MPYMQNGKKISLRVTDVEDGFAYNVVKSQMKKGSTISKNIHPVEQVEKMKHKLLITGKLIDSGTHYVLKKTITTGILMAYNLHYGKLINSRSENWRKDGYYAFANKKIEKEIMIKNIATSESTIIAPEFLDSLRLKEINKVILDFSYLNEQHNGDDFRPIEKLFFDELSKRGIISKKSRHGLTRNNECDIVDEENKIQIEVITEFKSRIKKTKAPQEDFDSIGLECIGNIFIKPSKALLDKYYEKNYTNKYKKHLAIYCLGDRNAVIGLACAIQEDFKQMGKTKNDFEDLYIIWNDFYNGNKTYLMHSIGDNKDNPLVEEIHTDISLIKKCGEVNCHQLNSDEYYFMNTESIFADKTAVGILPGNEIMKIINRLKIIIPEK